MKQPLAGFIFLASALVAWPDGAPAILAGQAAATGSLKQIVPGHFVYVSSNGGRFFNSGVIVTDEGVVVVDALESDAVGRAEQAAIAGVTRQPVRYLVSSSFHDPYSKGNTAYRDAFRIGHENYRAGLLDQMKRGNVAADEQKARLPAETFRDRVTIHLGGKEIQVLHFGPAHTRGDSIVFVPQDRIAYLSEVFFADEFPNMAQGFGVSWLRVLEQVETLGVDIFVPGHGPLPADPRATRASFQRMKQILVEARDAVQNQLRNGATEDRAAAAVTLQQYESLPSYAAQREVVVRRMYKELTGNLP
jgi:cyclase